MMSAAATKVSMILTTQQSSWLGFTFCDIFHIALVTKTSAEELR
jgi:hypothetical protein